MTKKQLLIWLLQVGLFTALGALQFVDKDSGGEQEGFIKTLCLFIYQHRLFISIIIGLIFAVLTGWKTLFYPRKRAKDIRQRIMQTMLDELLDGDKNNYRITIFKDANVFRRSRLYRAHRKRGRYVYVWERLGTEHPNSNTCFYYSAETARDCQGIAGAVMQGLTDIMVTDLPDIENIDLNSVDFNNKRAAATKAVISYMERGYINDFETLKRLHRKARHIYGNILNDIEGNPKGVLVIDSFLEGSFLSPEVVTRLSHYAIIVGATM
jgi:hypothetical protein